MVPAILGISSLRIILIASSTRVLNSGQLSRSCAAAVNRSLAAGLATTSHYINFSISRIRIAVLANARQSAVSSLSIASASLTDVPVLRQAYNKKDADRSRPSPEKKPANRAGLWRLFLQPFWLTLMTGRTEVAAPTYLAANPDAVSE